MDLAACIDNEFLMLESYKLAAKQILLLLSNQLVQIFEDIAEKRTPAGNTEISNRPRALVRPHDVFEPLRILNRTLSHIISSTVSGWEIDAPQPLNGISLRRGPIKEGELFRGEGLLDVSLINPMVACKCVFTSSGWVRRALTQEERLSAFDT